MAVFYKSLTGTQRRAERFLRKGDPKGEPAMPTLIWIAFWSSLVGTTLCLHDAARPVGTKAAKVKNQDRPRL
jgi:hypothetical protein